MKPTPSYDEYLDYLQIFKEGDNLISKIELVKQYYANVDEMTLSTFTITYNNIIEYLNIKEGKNTFNIIDNAEKINALQWRHYEELYTSYNNNIKYLTPLACILSSSPDVYIKDTHSAFKKMDEIKNAPAGNVYPFVYSFLDSALKLRKRFKSIYSDVQNDGNNYDGAFARFNEDYKMTYQLINMVANDQPDQIEYVNRMNIVDFLMLASYRLDKMKIREKQNKI